MWSSALSQIKHFVELLGALFGDEEKLEPLCTAGGR